MGEKCNSNLYYAASPESFPRIDEEEKLSTIVLKMGVEIYILRRLERNGKQMRSLRGHDIAMIFQDPMIALNPVYTIGWQICEMIRSHERVTKKEARARALQLLKDMGIPGS
ncbi:MAG: hypothetical protein ACLR0U_07310 [Enterocloster clostridioformis]